MSEIPITHYEAKESRKSRKLVIIIIMGIVVSYLAAFFFLTTADYITYYPNWIVVLPIWFVTWLLIAWYCYKQD